MSLTAVGLATTLGLSVAAWGWGSHRSSPTHDDANGTELAGSPFWRRAHTQKLLLLFFLLVQLSLTSFALGWNGIAQLDYAHDLALTLFAAYSAALVGWHLKTRSAHRRLVWHTAANHLIATGLLLVRLLPASLLQQGWRRIPNQPFFALRVAQTVAASLILARAATLPTGPPLYYGGSQEKPVHGSTPLQANVTQRVEASPLSFLIFGWAAEIINKGSQLVDLPHLTADFRSRVLYNDFSSLSWSRGLGSRVLWVNRKGFALQVTLAVIQSILYYAPAFFLKQIVSCFEQSSNATQTLGMLYCLGLLIGMLVESVVSGQLWYISNADLTSKIRAQLNTYIYAKALRRKDIAGNDSAQKSETDDDDETTHQPTFTSKNQVLNLFSVDVDRVADCANYSFTLVDAAGELFIGTFLLYQWLGIAGIIGILVNVLFLPLNHFTSKAFATTQDSLMSARDRRVSLMNEVLAAIRNIKYKAWEKPFETRVNTVRDEELRYLRWNYVLEISFDLLWSISPVACVVVSFWYFTKIQGNALTPSIAFASLSVLNELRFALNALPDVFVNVLQTLVSLRRIEAFVDLPEVAEVLPEPEAQDDQPRPIYFRNATLTWATLANKTPTPSPPPGAMTPRRKFVLSDLTIDFAPGGLNLVTGPVASGKTLLLLSCLGEADLLAGQMECPRSDPSTIERSRLLPLDPWVVHNHVAYVPQTAWLQNASIRDNILFGSPWYADRYQKVLFACSLLPDLAILEDGDQTEVGERGITLSGGQKQRVSLARAIYSRAGILLLDDVLSAVDSTTAKHLYEHALKGEIVQGRTIILVSHHTHLCAPAAAHVVVLGNGSVEFNGSREEFEQSPLADQYLGGHEEKEKPKEKKVGKPTNKHLQIAGSSTSLVISGSDISSSEVESSSDDDDASLDDGERKLPRKLVEEETRSTGHIAGHVWMTYLRASGHLLFWVLFAFVFIGAEIGSVVETLVLRFWSRTYDAATEQTHSLNFWLYLYTGVTVANVFVSGGRYLVLYLGALRASRELHQRMLSAVLRAKMRFYDKTALGILTNRFSKDLETIDSELPDSLGHALMYFLGVCTTIISVSSIAPWYLLGFSFLTFFYVHYGRKYSRSGRELRRLDSVSKTPIYSLYSETISGTLVIRGFGASSLFLNNMLTKVDNNLIYFYDLWAANRWLSSRFQILSAISTSLTGFVLLWTRSIDASLAGFALTFALNISHDILFLVRRYTALELAMVAVERVHDIAEVPSEGAAIIESSRPPAAWPFAGRVDVEHLYVRYGEELPDVISDVSFSVDPGERIGIVGATGSGKSSLASSFFRFQEAHSGRVVVRDSRGHRRCQELIVVQIDGIDISQIGLYDLRSRISMIAQDPTIFSGTLRSVLDVFGEHEDKDIYDCLRRVYLLPDPSKVTPEEAAENKFANLDYEVTEQGANFSSGERQLICMAQAMLARHKIMILDEATSSVDFKTDELISTTIADSFRDITLLVIAHRLRTIISFDKVLVLDGGRVLEYEKPATLLENPDSRFYQLCASTGPREFKILKKMASDPKRKGKVLRPKKVKRKTTRVMLGTKLGKESAEE